MFIYFQLQQKYQGRSSSPESSILLDSLQPVRIFFIRLLVISLRFRSSTSFYLRICSSSLKQSFWVESPSFRRWTSIAMNLFSFSNAASCSSNFRFLPLSISMNPRSFSACSVIFSILNYSCSIRRSFFRSSSTQFSPSFILACRVFSSLLVVRRRSLSCSIMLHSSSSLSFTVFQGMKFSLVLVALNVCLDFSNLHSYCSLRYLE